MWHTRTQGDFVAWQLMNKTVLPESKRPLTTEEVTYLEKEVVTYRRWHKFYLVAAFPLTPVGIVAVVGSVYALLVGDLLGVQPMQAFLVGMAVSVFCFSPLWLTFSMRDRGRDIQAILDTFPRADGDAEASAQ